MCLAASTGTWDTRRGRDAGWRRRGVPAGERWTVLARRRHECWRRRAEPLAARRTRRRRVDAAAEPGDGRLAEVTRRWRRPISRPAGGVRRPRPLPVVVRRRLGIHAAGLSVRQLRVMLTLLVRFVGVAGDRNEAHTLGQVHQSNTHRLPLCPAYLAALRADDHAVGRDRVNLVLGPHGDGADQSPPRVDTIRAVRTPLPPRPCGGYSTPGFVLGKSAVGSDQNLRSSRAAADDSIASSWSSPRETHADHPGRRPTHRAQRLVVRAEPDRHRALRLTSSRSSSVRR